MTLTPNMAAVAAVFHALAGALLSQVVNGMSHPPKKSAVTSADAVTMLTYSAMMNIENFIALYSM